MKKAIYSFAIIGAVGSLAGATMICVALIHYANRDSYYLASVVASIITRFYLL